MDSPRPIMSAITDLSFKNGIGRMKIETNELHVDDKFYLSGVEGKQGYFYFAEAPFSQVVIPDIQLGDFETKSPSKRLHSALFVLWEQQGKNGDFDSYYKKQMEKIIDAVKERLN